MAEEIIGAVSLVGETTKGGYYYHGGGSDHDPQVVVATKHGIAVLPLRGCGPGTVVDQDGIVAEEYHRNVWTVEWGPSGSTRRKKFRSAADADKFVKDLKAKGALNIVRPAHPVSKRRSLVVLHGEKHAGRHITRRGSELLESLGGRLRAKGSTEVVDSLSGWLESKATIASCHGAATSPDSIVVAGQQYQLTCGDYDTPVKSSNKGVAVGDKYFPTPPGFQSTGTGGCLFTPATASARHQLTQAAFEQHGVLGITSAVICPECGRKVEINAEYPVCPVSGCENPLIPFVKATYKLDKDIQLVRLDEETPSVLPGSAIQSLYGTERWLNFCNSVSRSKYGQRNTKRNRTLYRDYAKSSRRVEEMMEVLS